MYGASLEYSGGLAPLRGRGRGGLSMAHFFLVGFLLANSYGRFGLLGLLSFSSESAELAQRRADDPKPPRQQTSPNLCRSADSASGLVIGRKVSVLGVKPARCSSPHPGLLPKSPGSPVPAVLWCPDYLKAFLEGAFQTCPSPPLGDPSVI